MYIYIYITESLCCTPETLLINHSSIKIKSYFYPECSSVLCV